MKNLLIAMSLATGLGFAQTTQPAAKVHVKMVNGTAIKYTSKLKQVVELNFTQNYHHQGGRSVIDKELIKMGQANGFTILKFQSAPGQGQSDSGTAQAIPTFTLADLRKGQVIIANNISGMGSIYTKSKTTADAMQTAIETDGIGYLGIHGSGDQSGTSWPFYANTLHPVQFVNHANRTKAPVYKHLAEAKNIILEGILETQTKTYDVPNEVVNGAVQTASGVKGREMLNEWYQFNRQIADDAAYKDLVTMLLKYDGSKTQDQLPVQYQRKGGNMYTWIMKMGKAMGSYIPAGHTNDELMDPSSGFDGGSGDYDRYMGQLLWFLAGYDVEVCGASNCAGLPIVDSLNHLTGEKITTTGIVPSEAVKSQLNLIDGKVAFYSPFRNKTYEAKVIDMHGRVVASKTGKGEVYHEFDPSKFRTGVYFLSVKVGSSKPMIKRYAFMPGTR